MKTVTETKKKLPAAENRKAKFDVSIEQTFEAGIVLTGDEVKSVRANRMQLLGSYVKLMRGKKTKEELPEAVVVGLHLSLANDPERTRKLLLHSKELLEIEKMLATKGKVAVPLDLHFKRGWAKLSIGVGTGRKNYDKRELLKGRDLDRQQQAYLKRH